jgi:hypothetical protein
MQWNVVAPKANTYTQILIKQQKNYIDITFIILNVMSTVLLIILK